MKVLLIYPMIIKKRAALTGGAWAPLGLSFIAASLRRAGHEARIFDRYAAQASYPGRQAVDAAMLEYIRNFKPDMIGFNTLSPVIYDTVRCARLIREKFSGLLAAGGHHVSALPELTLEKIPELDFVFRGEGEFPLVKLAGGSPPGSIPGLYSRSGESTPPGRVKNLDDLPHPALELLEMDFYLRPGRGIIRGHHLSAVCVLSSRGCPKKCSFCVESLTYGGGVRYHSPEYVKDLLEKMMKTYCFGGVYFHDNDFLLDEERAAEICEGMLSLPRPVKFAVQAGAGRINERILKLLRKAGCAVIEIGIESSSQDELEWMDKQTTVDANERAVSLCKKHGVGVHAYMMTGFRGETLSDLENKLNWLKKVKPETFSLHPLKIFPGTMLYKTEKINFFENNDWTRENVSAYFRKDFLSSVPEEKRREWMKKKYNPFKTRSWRLNLLKSNSLPGFLSFLKAAITGSYRRFVP